MIAEQIQEVGPKYFILGTDFGCTPFRPRWKACGSSSLHARPGIQRAEVRLMTSVNPGKLLDLE